MKRFVGTACMLSILALLLIWNPWRSHELEAAATHYYVSPSGSDANSGTSPSAPFKTLQHALDVVQPGDTIHLAAGDYYEDVVTVRHGLPNAPILITGPSDAVLRGAGTSSRIFQIFHDYYTLDGFTIDGLHGDPDSISGYRDKLLYIQGTEVRDGPTGVRVLNMTFRNAGGECVRLRYFVTESEIAYNTFYRCGVHDFVFNAGGKNGEAIYVGTSSNQWGDGKNPTDDLDETTNNWIHHNFFDTQGNECVDIKEGAYNNIVEYNECTGQLDPNSAGLDSRGDNNVFRYNVVYGNVGGGVRLGGHLVNGHQYGVNNDVYGNVIYNNQAGGIKIQALPQGNICENDFSQGQQDPLFGDYASGSGIDPDAPCPAGTLPPTPTPGSATPTPVATPTPATSPSAQRLAVVAVRASGDDGNVPANTLDGDLGTRWSANGDGQWIEYDLGAVKTVAFVKIAFYKGDQRVAFFDMQVSTDGASWTQVYSGQSSGTSTALQTFDFNDTAARYVRIVGHGNTQNSWNSLTEVEVYGTSAGVSPTATPQPSASKQVPVAVRASGDDGNVPANTLDGDLGTRWSANGDGQWIEYDLGAVKTVAFVKIAFYKGNQRVAFFDVQVSTDGASWTQVYSGQSSGTSTALQTFDFNDTAARYVRIVGHSNTQNSWNSLTEVEVYGY